MTKQPAWLARATRVEMTLEISFILQDEFYYGPDDGSAEDFETKLLPLPQPVEATDGRLLSGRAGDGSGLAAHYLEVLRLGREHGHDLRALQHYFWLRPVMLFEQGAITFAWYDTWDEAEGVLEAIEQPGEGLVFHDVEQGWQVEMWAAGPSLFVRQSDFDTGEELSCVLCDRNALRAQVAPLRDRMERLLAGLRATVGGDHWTTLPLPPQ